MPYQNFLYQSSPRSLNSTASGQPDFLYSNLIDTWEILAYNYDKLNGKDKGKERGAKSLRGRSSILCHRGEQK
jgi:hypothetical protein